MNAPSLRLRGSNATLHPNFNISRDIPSAMFNPFNYLANATGQPAISLPLHWSSEGLPIGSLFTARYGEEATLLRLAAQLEPARPWAARRLPICAA